MTGAVRGGSSDLPACCSDLAYWLRTQVPASCMSLLRLGTYVRCMSVPVSALYYAESKVR
jgi:hypothetical protein